MSKLSKPKFRVTSSSSSVFIYAICGGDFIKFGRAKSVNERIGVLQTACPWKLEIIGFCEAPSHFEGIIHRYLSSDRAHGEWFKRTVATEWVAGLVKNGALEALASLATRKSA